MPNVLTPKQLGEYDVRAGFPKSPKVISEAIGYEEAESAGDASNEAQGPKGHIGAWSESKDFGTPAERLDPLQSSILARKQYEKSGWEAWAPYETTEAEGTGTDRAPKYVTAAEEALSAIAGKIASPKGNWPPKEEASSASSSGGASGVMKFLLTAALVLGGFALVGLGAMRSIGQRRSLEAQA